MIGRRWLLGLKSSPRILTILGLAAALVGFSALFGWPVGAEEPISPPQTTPVLDGFADIHVHQMANLGFAGSIIWGDAGGLPATALGPIPPDMRRGHDIAEVATHGGSVWSGFRAIVEAFIGDFFNHGEEGTPSFDTWPAAEIWTHQQVYKDWLFHSYQGGLRLMVMLADNSEDMFARGEDELPVFKDIPAQRVRAPGRTSNDMEALDWQIRAAYKLQSEIDAQSGGAGKGWYRIVRDPEEASKVISEGKLAVILGTELQHLFNCDSDRPACTRDTLTEGLSRLEAMGISYVFAVHHKLNQFAGPARFTYVNNGPAENCPAHQPQYTHDCSSVGLKDLGRFLVEELSARGMLIDTEHMSIRTFNDTMDIMENRHYPVFAGHVIPFELALEGARTERAKTAEQLKRIFSLGGIVAPILSASVDPQPAAKRLGARYIPISCNSADDGSVEQWTNAYLYIKGLAAESTPNSRFQLALGSDFGGFAGSPGPRDSCASSKEKEKFTYPYLLPAALRPAAISPGPAMQEFEFPQGKKWDFEQVGVAHVGMEPDFLRDVQLLIDENSAEKSDELRPIYNSARGVVDLWTSVRNRNEAWSRPHLIWAPEHPFETFDFPEAADPTRTVKVSDGLPICRTRLQHRLGFLKDGLCQLVDAPPAEVRDPGQLALYYNGRCLTGGDFEQAAVTQRACGDGADQKWYVLPDSQEYVRIENSMTGRCLTSVDKPPNGQYPNGQNIMVEAPCSNGNTNQDWRTNRLGNTFQLIGQSGCLGIEDQSRDDGVEIREQGCTGASNQLWSVEALRRNDYETLYQADKQRFQWLSLPTEKFHIAVEVAKGRPVCRAEAESWLGIVEGKQCVGKTYSGGPASTSNYEGLYQTS